MIKRFEHFWKGLSAPESQISAVPPDRYGDRFIKFISGITKTRERAEAEKEQQLDQGNSRVNEVIQNIEGTLDDPKLTGVNVLKNKDHNPAGTDKVMRKAEKQAEKSRLHGANEDDIPDRSISAVRSPHAENDNMVTLPVIGEAVENGSPSSRTPTRTITPQASKDSFRGRKGDQQPATQAIIGNAIMPNQSLGEVPPPTPPKTDGPPSQRSVEFDQQGKAVNNFSRPLTPPKDNKFASRGEQRPPTPPKDEKYRTDKALPLPPHAASTKLSASPARASEDEMEGLRTRVAGLST